MAKQVEDDVKAGAMGLKIYKTRASGLLIKWQTRCR